MKNQVAAMLVAVLCTAAMPAAASEGDRKLIALAEEVEQIRGLFDKAETCRRAARPRSGHYITYAGTSSGAYQRGRRLCETEMRRAILAYNAGVESRLERRIRTMRRSPIGDAIARHALARMPQCNWYPAWVRWGSIRGIRTGELMFMPMVEVKNPNRPRKSVWRRNPSERGGNGGR